MKEQRLLLILIGISASSHLLFLLINMLNSSDKRPTKPLAKEQIFRVTLLSSVEKANSPEKPKEEPDIPKAKKRELPQLPKNFQVQEKSPPADSPKIIAEKMDEKKLQQEKEKKRLLQEKELAKKKEEKKRVEEAKQRQLLLQQQEEEANKLYTEDLLRRMANENRRKERKQKKVKQRELAKKKKKEKELKSLLQQRQGEVQGGVYDSYKLLITQKIKSSYSLPRIYEISGDNRPTLLLMIDSRGAIKTLRVINSSNDPAFDKLALESVRKAAPFPKPPASLLGQAMHLIFDPRSF